MIFRAASNLVLATGIAISIFSMDVAAQSASFSTTASAIPASTVSASYTGTRSYSTIPASSSADTVFSTTLAASSAPCSTLVAFPTPTPSPSQTPSVQTVHFGPCGEDFGYPATCSDGYVCWYPRGEETNPGMCVPDPSLDPSALNRRRLRRSVFSQAIHQLQGNNQD